MAVKTPKIDERTFSKILTELRELAPHYTPEWRFDENDDADAAVGLAQIFAGMSETILTRLNETPRKHFIAFLNMLGIKLLPAQPARAPVQFQLAEGAEQGLDRGVLIPQRTQTVADPTDEREEPLPFETEQNLWAIPSKLVRLVGVDPGEDAIYLPPPKFLTPGAGNEGNISYKIISFSAKDSDSFQLDVVDGIEPGDLLRICLNGESDFYKIAEIVGAIVKVTEKLRSDYMVGTSVEKVTKFHVFESRNVQEHVLYLGHPDLFNVKSAAKFTLNVRHLAEALPGLTRLNVVWEYWSEKKDASDEKRTDWLQFEVESDAADGLSKDGEIILVKFEEGEIKEREINGETSRWIRARLDEKLPANETRNLPKLDKVALKVQSSGDELKPDLAFHNDTEVDVRLPFHPFGLEPRLFDRFYIGSQEAFSKRGAETKLKVRLDSQALLAAPFAIYQSARSNLDVESPEIIRVFTRGTGGRLIEVQINPTPQVEEDITPVNHGTPNDSKLALPNENESLEARPAAVIYENHNISVFVKAEDGRLYERYIDAIGAKWIDLGNVSDEVAVQSDPSVVRTGTNAATVFVIGKDGKLYSIERNGATNTPLAVEWKDLKNPSNGTILQGSPSAVLFDNGVTKVIKVFCVGQDKKLYEWNASANPDDWIEYSVPGTAENPFRIDSRPFAAPYAKDAEIFAKVFVKNDAGELWEFDARPKEQASDRWSLLGKPSDFDAVVASSPHGFVLRPEAEDFTNEGLHIFVRGSDSRLYERNDGQNNWKLYEPPAGVELRHSPFLLNLLVQNGTVYVYSGTNINALIERRLNLEIRGNAIVGAGKTLTIERDPSEIDFIDQRELEIIGGSGANEGFLGNIESYDKTFSRRLITFTSDNPSSESLDETSEYLIFSNRGQIRYAGKAVAFLESDNTTMQAYAGFHLVSLKESEAKALSTIARYFGDDKTAVFETSWKNDNSPQETDPYEIYAKLRGDGAIPDGTVIGHDEIKLAATASENKHAYKGFQIAVIDGPAAGQVRRITDYVGVVDDVALNEATVNSAWSPVPGPGARYQLLSLSGGVEDISNPMLELQKKKDRADNTGVYVGFYFAIVSGARQVREISGYDSEKKRLQFSSPWSVVPANGDEYEFISTEGKDAGIEESENQIALISSPAENSSAYVGFSIAITAGPGKGQVRKITEYVGGDEKTATVDSEWDAGVPGSGSKYELLPVHGIVDHIIPPQKPEDPVDQEDQRNDDGEAENGLFKIVLASPDGIPKENGAYFGFYIALFNGDGKCELVRMIQDYTFNKDKKEATVFVGNLPSASSFENLPYVIYSEPHGAATGGTEKTVDLASGSLGQDGAYTDFQIAIVGGSGSGQVRSISMYGLTNHRVTTDENWDAGNLPEDGSEYLIITPAPRETVVDAASAYIDFNADTTVDENNALNGFYVVILDSDNEPLSIRKILQYHGEIHRATVNANWGDEIDNAATYEIYPVLEAEEEQARGGGSGEIILSEDASKNAEAYTGLYIAVISGAGAGLVRKIKGYNDGRATVDRDWGEDTEIPGNSSRYRILTQHGEAQRDGANSFVRLDEVSGDFSGKGIAVKTKPILFRIIEKYDTSRKLAEFADAWDSLPSDNEAYRIYDPAKDSNGEDKNRGFAKVGTNKTITIDRSSLLADQVKGQEIQILGALGQIIEKKEIDEYHEVGQVVSVKTVWTTVLDSDTIYKLNTVNDLQGNWHVFKDPDDTNITPELSWEYWNGKGWVALRKEEHDFDDGTRDFLIDGEVFFKVPEDIGTTDTSGQESFWIRARIIGGDYGQQSFRLEEMIKNVNPLGPPDDLTREVRIIPNKNSIRPPLIQDVTICYELTENEHPKQVFPFNNLQYIDQTDANKTPDKHFEPFQRLEDGCRTIYLGFDEKFDKGPVRIYFAAEELEFDDENKPKMVWQYRGENNWKRLTFDDDSESLIKPEMLNLNVAKDFSRARRFGGEGRFWLRGVLEDGEYQSSPALEGVYPNSAWSHQAETIRDEILGSGNSEREQKFKFFQSPILKGEEVRVREVLTEEEKEILRRERGENAVVERLNVEDDVQEDWVLWSAVDGFFDSRPTDRHYEIDRATGEIIFGGARPLPVGEDNVRAFAYQAVIGGVKGNVAEEEIQTLATAIASVDAVINPAPAGGGTDTATVDQMFEFGPAQIGHRGRALTCEDFEWLTREASREVALVRCLPNLNRDGEFELGWVTVLIVPNFRDQDEPKSPFEMRRSIRRELEKRSLVSVANPRPTQIIVKSPEYQRIGVSIEVYVTSIDDVAEADRKVREKLQEFFHPLKGGPENKGWRFGRNVSVSDVYRVLEDVSKVDHVRSLKFVIGDEFKILDVVEIDDNKIVSNGEHEVNVKVVN